MVGATAEQCKMAIQRMKDGPANIPEVIKAGSAWTDSTFSGAATIYQTGVTASASITKYDGYIAATSYPKYFFKNVFAEYPEANIFDATKTPKFIEPKQGGAGTCYIMSSMGSIGEFPQIVKDVFLTQEKNSANIVGIRYFIRGKPWVVTVDSTLFFKTFDGTPINTFPLFAVTDDTKKIMWGAILEKAWAKIKGNYMAAEGGFTHSGMRSLTGAPVFSYKAKDS